MKNFITSLFGGILGVVLLIATLGISSSLSIPQLWTGALRFANNIASITQNNAAGTAKDILKVDNANLTYLNSAGLGLVIKEGDGDAWLTCLDDASASSTIGGICSLTKALHGTSGRCSGPWSIYEVGTCAVTSTAGSPHTIATSCTTLDLNAEWGIYVPMSEMLTLLVTFTLREGSATGAGTGTITFWRDSGCTTTPAGGAGFGDVPLTYTAASVGTGSAANMGKSVIPYRLSMQTATLLYAKKVEAFTNCTACTMTITVMPPEWSY